MIFDKQITKLKEFNRNAGRIAIQVVKDNEALVIDMVAEEQLFEQGIDGDGDKISSYMPYHPKTIADKRVKSQPTNRVTLRDTGEFHSSFKLNKKSYSVEMTATDEKTDDLIYKYEDDIFKLTAENLDELKIAYIKPVLIEKLRNAIRKMNNKTTHTGKS